LRDLFTSLGYSNVCTLLNSGNVVFTAPRGAGGRAEARIEEAFVTRFGFSARVTVLAAAELARVVVENPLGEGAVDPSRLLVTILNKPADRARLAPLAEQDWKPDVLAIGARAVYLWCDQGQIRSPLAEAVSRVLGDAATSRNWATVMKLQALVEQPAKTGP
jgi:uncharacterized protein (DUF1697 family)